MAPTSYSDVLLENLRAARARKQLDQADVSERMRALGYASWHRQTLGKVERDERRLTAAEVLGLALALETSMSVLLAGPPGGTVELGDGQISGTNVTVLASGRSNNAVRWDGNKPIFGPGVEAWMGGVEDDILRDQV
jgi:transcriptional regulator with XRE-family HTH domain